MTDPALPTPRKSSSRVVSYLIVLIVVAAVVAIAFYQEQISYGMKLRTWDSGAPGQAVVGFLTAGKQGDRARADGFIGTKEFKPLDKGGQWVGYYLVSNAGTLDFTFAELAPAGEPRPTETQFVLVGDGAAFVVVPDARGKGVKYRLEMVDGSWKITEILGGRPRNSG